MPPVPTVPEIRPLAEPRHEGREAPARSPSSGSRNNENRSPACRSCKRSTTIRVEERLLLNWVTLYPADIAPGGVERSAAVEADFTNPGLPVGDGAAMSAGIAANPVAVQFIV